MTNDEQNNRPADTAEDEVDRVEAGKLFGHVLGETQDKKSKAPASEETRDNTP